MPQPRFQFSRFPSGDGVGAKAIRNAHRIDLSLLKLSDEDGEENVVVSYKVEGSVEVGHEDAGSLLRGLLHAMLREAK